jgi:hypothetical protein
VAVLLALAGAARAQVKDPAELLPAHTLACVEVRQPERLSQEVAALLKGSALDDMPATLARFRAKLGANNNPWAFYQVGELGMFLSPEMVREGGRLQGGVLALTGIGKGGPEYVGVLLCGDSNIPTLFVRGNLLFGNIRIVSEVEGIPVYQEQRQVFTPKAAAGAPPAPAVEDGSAMAILPGAIAFGAKADAVKDVIRRFKGKSADPALASVSAYKEAATLRDRPGLFAYADLGALAAQVDELAKTPGLLSVGQWEQIKAAVNPQAFRSITASLTLGNGNVELHARVQLDPRQKSPLADLLPDRAVPGELLHFVPRDALLATAVDLGDGAKRWQKLLAVADAVVKVPVPRGPGKADSVPPSEVMRGLEEKLKLNVGKDVLGRLTGAAVVVDPETAGGPPRSPMLVLQATDAEAARFLEEQALPKLVGLTTGEVPLPAREQVEGRRISTVAAGLFPGWKALHYGRQGPFLVLGPDRNRVALALTAGGKKEGLLGEARVADAVKALDRPVALGVASLGQGLVRLFKMSVGAPVDQQRVAPVAAPPPPGGPPAAEKKPPKVPEEVEKAARELAKVVEPLPPAVFGLTRKPDSLTLEVRQTSLRRVSARVINVWVEGSLQRAFRGQGMPGGFGAVGVPMEAVDTPPPPPPPPAPAKDAPKKIEKKP